MCAIGAGSTARNRVTADSTTAARVTAFAVLLCRHLGRTAAKATALAVWLRKRRAAARAAVAAALLLVRLRVVIPERSPARHRRRLGAAAPYLARQAGAGESFSPVVNP